MAKNHTYIPGLDDPDEFLKKPVSAAEADRFLYDSLKGRYGKSSWTDIADLYQKEIGLDPYSVKVKTRKELPANVNGVYSPSTRAVVLNPNILKDNAKTTSTMVHETSHAADDILAPRQSYKDHHKNYNDFDLETPMVLKAQRIIEEGGELPKALYDRYPWLKNVTPLSSNPIANPWSGQLKEKALKEGAF